MAYEQKLILQRVSYGSQKTPIKQREYSSKVWGSPVGTKTEWEEWVKGINIKIKFKEKP